MYKKISPVLLPLASVKSVDNTIRLKDEISLKICIKMKGNNSCRRCLHTAKLPDTIVQKTGRHDTKIRVFFSFFTSLIHNYQYAFLSQQLKMAFIKDRYNDIITRMCRNFHDHSYSTFYRYICLILMMKNEKNEKKEKET